jgi:hypothetical protein
MNGVTIPCGPRVAHWVAWQAVETPSQAKHRPRGRFHFLTSDIPGFRHDRRIVTTDKMTFYFLFDGRQPLDQNEGMAEW